MTFFDLFSNFFIYYLKTNSISYSTFTYLLSNEDAKL